MFYQCTGGGGGSSIDFPYVKNLGKFTGFWYEYGCIQRDKTDSIASILMNVSTLVVTILLKHKINEVL